jgi:phosphopantothenate---cysteine ligase (ATP)
MKDSYILEDRLTETEIKNLKEKPNRVLKFTEAHPGKTVTLITSGGTSVPLEKRSVRFLENFSTGLRGSLLAESLLKKGEPVIFFYRDKTHLPFSGGIKINDILS